MDKTHEANSEFNPGRISEGNPAKVLEKILDDPEGSMLVKSLMKFLSRSYF